MSRACVVEVLDKKFRVKCFDSGPAHYDRYIVFYSIEHVEVHPGLKRSYYPYLAMSENPMHPQGFGQHGESPHPPKPGRALGTRIKFEQLPLKCREAVVRDCLLSFPEEMREAIGMYAVK